MRFRVIIRQWPTNNIVLSVTPRGQSLKQPTSTTTTIVGGQSVVGLACWVVDLDSRRFYMHATTDSARDLTVGCLFVISSHRRTMATDRIDGSCQMEQTQRFLHREWSIGDYDRVPASNTTTAFVHNRNNTTIRRRQHPIGWWNQQRWSIQSKLDAQHGYDVTS